MIVIGADTHKRSHTVAAVEAGRTTQMLWTGLKKKAAYLPG